MIEHVVISFFQQERHHIFLRCPINRVLLYFRSFFLLAESLNRVAPQPLSPLSMVKTTSLTKQELKDVLKGAKTSKERNRAVKLLKQFDPNPDYKFDDEGTKSKLRPKKYDYLQSFVCDRSDKVNVSYHKVLQPKSMLLFWGVLGS